MEFVPELSIFNEFKISLFRNLTLDHRLTAAVDNECAQMDRLHFVDNLQKSGCALNVEMLTNLALHEPESFSALIELAHRNRVFTFRIIWPSQKLVVFKFVLLFCS